MDYKEKIDKIVEEALSDKTFSLEVVQRIKQLKDDLESLEAEKEKLTEKLELSDKNYHEVKALLAKKTEEHDVLSQTVEEWEKREEGLIKRETKVELVEQRANMEAASRTEIKELVGLLFKNPVVRKTRLVGHVTPNSTPGSYPNISSTNDVEEESTE